MEGVQQRPHFEGRLASDAPLPVSATWNAGPSVLTVVFDQPLEADPTLNAANWTMQRTPFNWAGTLAAASGNTVAVVMAAGPPYGGPSLCDYAPPPADVIGLNALPAAAFSGLAVA